MAAFCCSVGLDSLAWRLYEDPDPATRVYIDAVTRIMASQIKAAKEG